MVEQRVICSQMTAVVMNFTIEDTAEVDTEPAVEKRGKRMYERRQRLL